jgi:hypothetical protein
MDACIHQALKSVYDLTVFYPNSGYFRGASSQVRRHAGGLEIQHDHAVGHHRKILQIFFMTRTQSAKAFA